MIKLKNILFESLYDIRYHKQGKEILTYLNDTLDFSVNFMKTTQPDARYPNESLFEIIVYTGSYNNCKLTYEHIKSNISAFYTKQLHTLMY